jgi:hypothetical protein
MIPIFAKAPAEKGCECWNRTTRGAGVSALTRLTFAALIGMALPLPAGAQTGAQARQCEAEVARLRKAETELPRLSVAPPGDKQIVCITLETNLMFARRLSDHLKQCPGSPFVKLRDAWVRIGKGYAAQFAERGCKPALRD